MNTNRERAKAWMLEQCSAEASGTRMGVTDVDGIDFDTETGVPCNCLDALTRLLDDVCAKVRDDERERIVRWLYEAPVNTLREGAVAIAEDVERGTHVVAINGAPGPATQVWGEMTKAEKT
jgi:hypothetical protein